MLRAIDSNADHILVGPVCMPIGQKMQNIVVFFTEKCIIFKLLCPKLLKLQAGNNRISERLKMCFSNTSHVSDLLK